MLYLDRLAITLFFSLFQDNLTTSVDFSLPLFQIYFGTSAGHLIVTEKNLARISDTEISNGVAITCMSWSCEKFKMEDGDDRPASE